MTPRHPFTEGWVFPPADRPALPSPLARTNIRELCARPERFEHHLLVVARIGDVQLEIPTASEPLAFAHVNVSDEYVVVLPTGHAMLDAFPYRVFVSDPSTQEDVLRLQHKTLDLVLHPYGYSHWPGRLRPPYAPPPIPPGMRRAMISMVLCACTSTPPPKDRELWVTPGNEAGAKAYREDDVPVLLASLGREPSRRVARVADVTWELVVDPDELVLGRGGYVTVLEADPESAHFAADLIYVPTGAKLDARGIRRALVMQSDACAPEPPPASWRELPTPTFAPIEEAPRGTLPVSLGDLRIEALDRDRVRVSLQGVVREVPRYWLSRMLFRWALHNYQWGHTETYEGFFVDDTGGSLRVGLSGVGHVTDEREIVTRFVEQAYRACAPEGYVEHIG